MRNPFRKQSRNLLLAGGFLFCAAVAVYLWRPFVDVADRTETKTAQVIEVPKVRHIATPTAVRAIYMTSWVAGTDGWRKELVDFVKKTEVNSIVIDVKDYSGHILFDTGDEIIKKSGAEEVRSKDMKEFIEILHDADIYAIARITVFQDPFYSKNHLSTAVQRKNGTLWKDRKGLSYVDPSSQEFWDYIIRIAQASEKVGFDELNFDYIRFPSDGDMKDIRYPVSDFSNGQTKSKILESFFAYLQKGLASTGVPLSADVFGMVTTNYDDLNIGQVLESIAPYFDYIAPMVYPSHYPPTFLGYKKPAEYPYEVVKFSMEKAVGRMITASTTPSKLRPWLQDFNLGATYDAAKIKAQKKAVYDAGLNSWMMWDPANKYTRGGYDTQ